ncbi:conjugal transfer/type IV secretion protein DotA/TraY [Methylophilus rhizosphaerae]|uniref:Conjugal transfer/type IV secretion protein DotA/TraY n=1 Tax=Methylophilus rhizosphaerae TaxID=492660 RepID=A0A1G9A9P7_9PROT|nr:DotA/TraY family protein [Methylophilus rhizosphaerae]SDK24092.1 conjugal transfer/type IV secretion protein DotA/TraY [Methylophilus rhizosphaerae]
MNYLKLLAVFLAIIVCEPAFAGAINIFDPASQDLSLKIINQIFGGLVDGGNDALGGAIAIFNGAILAIGGILAGYTVLAGTLGTAHDGEMLGKKFSSVWLPIRYSLGTALVIPISSAGYCGMQFIVMWCITQGIGLADAAWSSFMETPTHTASASHSVISKAEILDLAKTAFTASACVNGYKKFVEDSDPVLGFKERYKFSIKPNSNGDVSYGFEGNVVDNNICGNIALNNSDIKNIDSQIPDHSFIASNNEGHLGNLDSLFKPIDISQLREVRKNAVNNLIESADALAIQVLNDKNYKNNSQVYYSYIEKIADSYSKEIQDGARTLKQPEEVKKQENGWLVAGAYYHQIIINNQAISKAVNIIPESRASKSLHFTTMPDDDIAHYLVASDILNASQSKIKTGATPTSRSDGMSGGDDSGSGISASIGNQIADTVSTINLEELSSDDRHLTLVMSDMGVRMIQAYTTILAINATARFSAAALKEASTGDVSTVVSFGGAKIVAATAAGSLEALSALSSFLLIPLTAMLAIGFFCAYIIPFIPFFFWLACIIGYFIQICIAIMAAPLWAIMHLHPNGDDLSGKGGDGYTLVLGVILRPVLLICGLIISIILSSLFGEFISKTFLQLMAFTGSNLDGWLSFFTIIFGAGLYAVLAFYVLKNTYKMMYLVSDETLKWIGGGKDAIGSYAQEMSSGIEKGGNSATGGFIGGFAGTMASKNVPGELGKTIGGAFKSKELQATHITPENVDAVNDSFNEKFGAEASDKKEKALGFSIPNGFTEQSKSSSYDSSMNSVINAKGLDGVASYQNEVIKYAESGNVLNEKSFRNIAKSIIES